MSATENKLKQRIVGALVLIALAVVFIPMLLKQEEPVQEVTVPAPAMPAVPKAPEYPTAPVTVPVPEPVVEVEDVWGEPLIVDEPSTSTQAPSAPIATVDEGQPDPAPEKTAVAPVKEKPEPEPTSVVPDIGIDKNNLPVSWSVQLASLSNQVNAQNLRDTYRKKQYNAYVRSSGEVHRVFIGPLIKRSEAQNLCKNLKARENQDCFVVRYEPETSQ